MIRIKPRRGRRLHGGLAQTAPHCEEQVNLEPKPPVLHLSELPQMSVTFNMTIVYHRYIGSPQVAPQGEFRCHIDFLSDPCTHSESVGHWELLLLPRTLH